MEITIINYKLHDVQQQLKESYKEVLKINYSADFSLGPSTLRGEKSKL